MDSQKLLQIVRRVRSANAARDRDLEEIQIELEKFQAPDQPRKRRNLKEERVDHFERVYATGKFTKPVDFKRAK